MSQEETLVKYTAIYRCSDDITNLKIRVKLRQVGDLTGEDSDGWEQKDFAWQQKCFSKSEREYYKDEKNCITDLEKKYHSDVGESHTEAHFDLFSYTNDDDFALKQEVNDNFRENCDENGQGYDYGQSLVAAVRNPIGHNYEFEVMYIMADLGEYIDSTWLKQEQVLCVVKYDRKYKILSINPDFTKSQPYLIRLEGATIRKYHYFLENVSAQMPEEAHRREKELIRKINGHKTELLKCLSFKLPAKNKLAVHLFMELAWAQYFEYGPIYVQYFIDLPSDWSPTDQSQLQGVTQTCHVTGDEGLAHFGHVFDVTLEYNIEDLGKRGIPKCPYIYFEVISKDTWSRYRTEGLTYKALPVAKPGNYRFNLQCFRLIPDRISGQLRRFFIGDCSSYGDLTWVGLPKHYDGPVLNKYGTNTVGTGLISVTVHVVHQSQAFLDKYRENSEENLEIFEKLNSSSLVKSVEQVLQAFKRARKNKIAARKFL
ncbi:Meckel syndrome type 1 protein-like Protein [Tribolium castaneum]|uniref:Meckel syndrome type 1 protein-like Protein n=1 Tax=Tribolium castaneum TaxID=7070 RepID=D6WUJ1_TRICA|nr:PREDICTED: Meckel syndrome type 1 protein [Tribolium castaneum]EFA08377.1 Meckel syndrome type 1 protein-like Protein [Tribolium castaneum]|eukprot:XP_001813387.1 PREDICTED: Meckel syndrome type 1 protein [Tribolium castaneum]